MIKLNTSRILVPFDFSLTAKRALKHAASLGKLNSGEVQLLYVRKPKTLITFGYSFSELRTIVKESQNYKKLMEITAQEIRDQFDIPVKVLVGIGGTIRGILKVCEKNNIGLIVMGTEGSESVSNLFGGSNSQLLVSKSPIPVITVRAESPRQGYSEILLPIDTSVHTRQKVMVAIRLAKSFLSRIHLLGLQAAYSDEEPKLKAILKQIEKRLQEESIPYTTEIKKTDNAAASTIAVAKRKNADIIVCMTDQNAGSLPLLSKTYDHELIEESNIPVMSVPPEIHEENIESASVNGLW